MDGRKMETGLEGVDKTDQYETLRLWLYFGWLDCKRRLREALYKASLEDLRVWLSICEKEYQSDCCKSWRFAPFRKATVGLRDLIEEQIAKRLEQRKLWRLG
jgi:hypothetical protein